MTQLINGLRKFDSWIAVCEKALVVVGAVGLTVAVLIGRFAASPDAYEWAKVLMIWVGLLAASLAARERKHIVVDLMGAKMPWRVRGVLAVFAGVVATALMAFLARVALLYVAGEQARGIRSDVTTPFGHDKVEVWVFETILIIGFAMLSWRFLLAMLEDIRALATGDRRHFTAHLEGPPEETTPGKA